MRSCGPALQLRYVHYVDTFETYPYYCQNASAIPAINNTKGWQPNNLECDGEHAM